MSWSPWDDKEKKHKSYILVTGYDDHIMINFLEFDIGSMQYILTSEQCQMPSAGLSRKYTCSMISRDAKYLFLGTEGGELAIFNIMAKVFKALLPVSVNGIWSVVEVGGSIFCGSGDGKVKKLIGQDTKWQLDSEIILKGMHTSASWLSPADLNF